MKVERIQAGMTLYDVHKTKMGNTTLSTVGIWPVYIVSIDHEKARAVVRWNGNREQTYYRGQLEKLRETEPVLIRSALGVRRLATRAEIAEMKKSKEQA